MAEREMFDEENGSVRPFAVYVAGTSAGVEVDRVAAAVHHLRACEFAVVNTWSNVIATVGVANPRNASIADRRGWSMQCLAEIDGADAVWFLVPTPPTTTRGGWWEAGHACATSKHLVFSGDTKQSIFCALGIECETDAAALAHLRALRDAVRVDEGLRELAANAPEPIDHLFDVGGES